MSRNAAVRRGPGFVVPRSEEYLRNPAPAPSPLTGPALQAVLAACPEPVLLLDARGRVVAGSATGARLAGLPDRELPGARITDLALPLDLRLGLEAGLGAVLESGVPCDHVRPTADGPPLSVCGFHVAPIREADESVRGAICRFDTVPLPALGDGRFRALGAAERDTVFNLDLDLRYTHLFGPGLELLGISPDAAPGRRPTAVPGAELGERHEAAAQRARAGETVVYNWEAETAHGRLFLETSLAPIRDADGTVTGIIGICRDLTSRQREREELSRLANWSRQVREEWKCTLDSLPEFVALVDYVGCVVRGNSVLETWGLRGPEDIAGASLHDLLHPGCPGQTCYLVGAMRRAWDAILEGREEAIEADDPHLRRYVRVSFRPVLRSDSRPAIPTMLTIVRDLTASRRAQLDRDRMELQLRQAQKLEALAQLASGLSHEISTPVQLVADQLRSLRDGMETASTAWGTLYGALERAAEEGLGAGEARRLLEELKASAPDTLRDGMPAAVEHTLAGVERVAAIGRALKEFAEAGPGQHTPVDIRRAVRNATMVTRHRWEAVAEVTTDFDPAVPDIPCDPSDLHQVLYHFLVNAADAVAEARLADPVRPGRIRIEVRRDDTFAVIRVSDNGPGIAEELRPRLFEPFFTTKPEGEGTGQGLPYCQALVVKKYRGRIELETEPGVGSTFVIHLPL